MGIWKVDNDWYIAPGSGGYPNFAQVTKNGQFLTREEQILEKEKYDKRWLERYSIPEEYQ